MLLYGKLQPLLGGLSLCELPIVIEGGVGSGKSTLAQTLVSLNPQKKVIDDYKGESINLNQLKANEIFVCHSAASLSGIADISYIKVKMYRNKEGEKYFHIHPYMILENPTTLTTLFKIGDFQVSIGNNNYYVTESLFTVLTIPVTSTDIKTLIQLVECMEKRSPLRKLEDRAIVTDISALLKHSTIMYIGALERIPDLNTVYQA